MSIQQLNNLNLKAGLEADGDVGSAGQVLSSTGPNGIEWINQSTLNSGSAERTEILVKNLEGSALSKGDPVYIIGSVGASERLQVGLANAGDAAKMPCIGLLTQDLAINGEGTAIVTGKLKNLITSPIDGATPIENDTIYVKSGGGLTLTKPTGSTNLIQNVGQVGRVSTSSDGNIVVSAILRSNDVPNLPTGRIWVGDGNTTVSDVVYLDETNERMGIGTTSPSRALEINTTGSNDYQFRIGTGAYYYDIGRNTLNGFLNFYGNQSNASGFVFETVNGERMRIDHNGNVGIGTTSPAAKLQIEAPSGDFLKITESGVDRLTLDSNSEMVLTPPSNWGSYFKMGNNVGAYEVALELGTGRSANGYSYIDLIGDTTYADYGFRMIRNNGGANTTSQLIHRGTGNFELVSSNSGDIILNPNSGNVGIGTTNPTQKLEVSGTVKSSGLDVDGQGNSATNFLQYTRTDSTQPASISYDGSGGFDFNLNGGVVKFSKANSGSVGIGTTSPSYKLDVDGEARFGDNQGILLTDDSGTSYVRALNNHLNLRTTRDADDIYFSTGTTTTTKMFIQGDTGNVGIGTPSPSDRLEVAAANSQLRLTDTDDSKFTQFSYSSGKLVVRNNSTITTTNQFTLDAAGEIGIGTTSPDSKLQISGSGTQRLRVTSTDGANADLSCDGTSSMTLGSPNGIPIRFVTSNAERMRVSLGNVGIGTTSPGNSLSIAGGNPSTTTLGTNFGQFGIFNASDQYGIQQWVTGSGDGHIQVGRIDGTAIAYDLILQELGGNVGIGTTNPAYRLQLALNSAAKPTSSAWTVVSDERVKTNIRPYETGLEELLQVKPKIFDYNGKAGFDTKAKNNIGVIAQEIKDVMPETVKKYNAKLNKEDKEYTELYDFDSHALTFALINSVKELNAKIEQLETRIQTLENN